MNLYITTETFRNKMQSICLDASPYIEEFYFMFRKAVLMDTTWRESLI